MKLRLRMHKSTLFLFVGISIVLGVGFSLTKWATDTASALQNDNRNRAKAEELVQVEGMIRNAFDELASKLNARHWRILKLWSKLENEARLEAIYQTIPEDVCLGLHYVSLNYQVLAEYPVSGIGDTEKKFVKDMPGGQQMIPPLLRSIDTGENQISSPVFDPDANARIVNLIVPLIPKEDLLKKGAGETKKSEVRDYPPFLVAEIDFLKQLGLAGLFDVSSWKNLLILSSDGTIVLHPNPSLMGADILTRDGLGASQKKFLQAALEKETHAGKYKQTLFGKEQQWEEFGVSRKVNLGDSSLILILPTQTDFAGSYLTFANRGFLISLLFICLGILVLGQIWHSIRKREIESAIRKRMSKELEKMVEDRTVELNFVTRTIKDLIDSIPSALVVLDRNLNILLVNLSFYSIFSSRIVNITGKKITEIFSDDFKDRLQDIMRTKQPIVDLEIRKFVEGHGEKVLQINVLHLLGKRDRLLLVIDDITDRKVLERQLIQAEKMAGLGTLMSGVAHEINNPLNAIAGMSQIILARTKEESTKEDADQIQQYVKRVAEIVKELSRYSRSTKVTDAVVGDINQIIEGAIGMVSHSRKLKDVDIEREFSDSLPEIMVNIIEMEQVFINLISNAADALEESAKVMGENFVKQLRIRTDLFAGENVEVVVQDNGAGIPPENMKSIFDPFFTTKEQGKGTGLGLSISYKIVQRYGGIILVDSQPGLGTKFTVRIPTA